jgi:hypothetical protein
VTRCATAPPSPDDNDDGATATLDRRQRR